MFSFLWGSQPEPEPESRLETPRSANRDEDDNAEALEPTPSLPPPRPKPPQPKQAEQPKEGEVQPKEGEVQPKEKEQEGGEQPKEGSGQQDDGEEASGAILAPPSRPPHHRSGQKMAPLDMKQVRSQIAAGPDLSTAPARSVPNNNNNNARPTSARFNLNLSALTFENQPRGAQTDRREGVDLSGPVDFVNSVGSFFRDSSNSIWDRMGLTPRAPSNPVFGVPLHTLPLQGDVPEVIAAVLAHFYDNQAWMLEGLFRLSGSFSRISAMRDLWNRGDTTIAPRTDCHDVCGFLKRFFKELDEPLITAALHDEFMDAAKRQPGGEEEQLSKLTVLVGRLPDVNRCVLCRVVHFLCIVVAHAKINRMSDANVGKTMGPTLLTYGDSLAHLGTSVSLIVLFINNFERVFGKYQCLSFEKPLEQIRQEAEAEAANMAAPRLARKSSLGAIRQLAASISPRVFSSPRALFKAPSQEDVLSAAAAASPKRASRGNDDDVRVRASSATGVGI